MPATEAFYNRLAVVFDYNDTLAPDSFTELLEHLGHDRDTFNEERGEEPIAREMLRMLGRGD